MDRQTYSLVESYMLSCMTDSAHDKEHIYRVLYTALDIAKHETNVDYDILICACLLHDIGRNEQFENPSVCHAEAGSEKAVNVALIGLMSHALGFDRETLVKAIKMSVPEKFLELNMKAFELGEKAAV